MLSIRFLATVLLTLGSAGACVLTYGFVQLRLGDQSLLSAPIQVIGALAVCVLPALIAPDDEKRLCVAVAAAPLLLILGAMSVAALTGQAPKLALAQFGGLAVALYLLLWAIGRWQRGRRIAA